jgi:hypothetical protein
MAHKLNINFGLYTALDSTALESLEALTILKNSGILFSHIHYFDTQQMQEVINSLKTWFVETEHAGLPENYPFVIYQKAYDITDTIAREPVIVHGLAAIQATDWNALANFKG